MSISGLPGPKVVSLRELSGRWAGPLIILLAAVLGAAWSWAKWPDPVIDFGRELYVPWRLAEGDVLYRDIASFNGPLSPWLIATVFQVFGPSLHNLATMNLVLIMALSLLIYRMIRILATRVTATLAGLTFLGLFAFSQLEAIGNSNWMAPYSHEMTHGIALSFVAIYGLYLYGREGRERWLIAAGFLLGLVFLTKAEVFLAACVGVSAGLLTLSLARGEWRTRVRAWWILLLSGVMPFAISVLLLRLSLPWDRALLGALGTWPHLLNSAHSSLPFFRWSMGLDVPWVRLQTALRWWLGYGLFLAVPALLSLGKHRRAGLLSWVVGLVSGASLLVAFRIPEIFGWVHIPSPWQFILFMVWVGLVWKLLSRSRAPNAEDALRFALTSYALALLGKMVLHVRIWQYGFGLAMPASLIIVLLLWHDLPAFLVARKGDASVFRAAVAGAWIAVLVIHLAISAGYYRAKTFAFGEGADRIWADPRGRVMEDARRFVGNLASAGDSLVVLPEGVLLNYQLRLVNPTPFSPFSPPVGLLFGEELLTRAVVDSKADWIIRVDSDYPAYGPRSFGVDYHEELDRWVLDTYRWVASIGPPPFQRQGFGVWIGRRSPSLESEQPTPGGVVIRPSVGENGRVHDRDVEDVRLGGF